MAQDPTAFAKRVRAVIGATKSPSATAPGAAPVAFIDGVPVSPASDLNSLTGDSMSTPITTALVSFTAEDIATHNPAVAATLRKQGAEQERARIAAVREQAMPGHDALIERLAADGNTSGPEAAMAVLAAERQSRVAQATARAADAPKPVAQEPAPAAEERAPKFGVVGRMHAGMDLDALHTEARAYMAAHPGTAYVAALKATQALAKAA